MGRSRGEIEQRVGSIKLSVCARARRRRSRRTLPRSLSVYGSPLCTSETFRETHDEQSSSRQRSPFRLVAAWPKSAASAVLRTGHADARVQIGHVSMRTFFDPPPNKALKLSRPGFGPAAEPPGPNSTCAAARRLQIVLVKCGIRRAAVRAAARHWPRSLAPVPLDGSRYAADPRPVEPSEIARVPR